LFTVKSTFGQIEPIGYLKRRHLLLKALAQQTSVFFWKLLHSVLHQAIEGVAQGLIWLSAGNLTKEEKLGQRAVHIAWEMPIAERLLHRLEQCLGRVQLESAGRRTHWIDRESSRRKSVPLFFHRPGKKAIERIRFM
jgi:hypothetical protein